MNHENHDKLMWLNLGKLIRNCGEVLSTVCCKGGLDLGSLCAEQCRAVQCTMQNLPIYPILASPTFALSNTMP